MSSQHERFSIPLSRVFVYVQNEVKRLGHFCVEPEHLLLGLLEEKEGLAYRVLTDLKVDLTGLKVELHQYLSQLKVEKSCEALTMSEATKRMLEFSMETSHLSAVHNLGTEHLLLGMMRDISGHGYSLLRRYGVTYNRLLQQMEVYPAEPISDGRVISKLSLEVPYVPAEKLTLTGIFMRISPVFWGMLLLSVLSGMAAYFHWFRADVAVFLFVTIGWVVAVCIHEFGHALVAYLGGDQGVIQRGYLALNPLRYTHGFMSIVLPVLVLLLGGIGLPGGAVYVNLGAVRNNKLRSFVAAAGPLMTLVTTIFLAIMRSYFNQTLNFSQHSEFIAGLNLLIFIQIWALIFNLLPLPGFDGFGIIMPFLPSELAQRLHRASSLILFLFITLYLWDTPVQRLFWHLVYQVMSFLDVDRNLIFYGLDLYRFW